ncbi:MAG: Fe(3+)-transporting ATPase [Frankiales bacterium]|nr:Fe(3+)-transporting ATPase [Frankiales bacterium]
MIALELRGVTKSFGSTPVLQGIDLDIAAGSLTAVLGPSGCGKTTLLRLIAGFAAPDAGIIRFGDRVVFGAGRMVPARDRKVGYVPQEGALFPHLSVAANVTFGLPRAQRRGPRLVELLQLVGLDQEVGGRYPHELSGGQQQRVALARALAPSPAVVLLDEPFSSLDAGLREDTGRAVSVALRAAGATAVLVTHDQGEALSLADQVAVMREGRLIQVDEPTRVYRHPRDPGVARFVGGAVLLPGTVEDRWATCALGRLAVEGASLGGPVEVLVRPEQIRLGAEGVPARVQEVSYFGHDASVRLGLLPGGPTVVARVTGGEVPSPGDDVHLRVAGGVPVFAVPAA